MPWALESESQRIELQPGKTITVGRTDRAMAMFPGDQWMSSLHFAVGVSAGVLRLQNLSKTNGTEVNGARVEAIALQPGDQVKAGATVFAVRGPSPSPFPAQIRFGGWGFEFVPQGWQLLDGMGFELPSSDSFVANMSAVEEPLPEGKALAAYVETQMELVRGQVPGAQLSGPVAAQIRGAEEALALSIASPTQAGQAIQRQIYAAHRGVAGIFTMTMLETQAVALRDTLSTILRGLSFFEG